MKFFEILSILKSCDPLCNVDCCLSTIVTQEENIFAPIIRSWGDKANFRRVASLKAQCTILLHPSRWEAGVKKKDHVFYTFPCLTNSGGGGGQFISLLLYFYCFLPVEPGFFWDSSSHELAPLWDCRLLL